MPFPTTTAGPIDRLQQALTRLPGIGPKSAERLAHHLLNAPPEEIQELTEALRQVKERIRHCRQCYNYTEQELCSLCTDPRRDPSVICVVEQPRDLLALERASIYRGLYHVLLGRIAPLDNCGPDDLTIEALVQRVRQGGVVEVIMATSPTLEGDGTALYVSNLLAPLGVKITRLARGISAGSGLEFANKDMLADALTDRRAF
jgi:recombination protein RecR